MRPGPSGAPIGAADGRPRTHRGNAREQRLTVERNYHRGYLPNHKEPTLSAPEKTIPDTVDHAPEPIEGEGPTVVVDTGLDHGLLDRDAVRAVARLQERGFEAYLVGGCVRDLMLGQRPKDFDIATSARPAQVKRVFPRNCRIIGRRFKLAHLHFDDNRKILEVATFRRDPSDREGDIEEDEDLLITRDNEFGTAEEDARRRDFTINALFLDPVADEILDHTGGLADLDRRMIRTIGDPETRFREDPVRILRAIKFASRLELDFDPETEAAMRATVEDLTRAAPPRLLEELLRLLRGGHALDAFLHLRDLGALEVLLPDVHEFLESTDDEGRVRFWRTIEAVDGSCRRAAVDASYARHWPPLAGVLLGALFAEPVAAATTDDEDASDVAERICGRFAIDYKLPKKDSAALKRTTAVQSTLHASAVEDSIDAKRFGRRGWFRESLDLFAWTNAAHHGPSDAVARWRRLGKDVPRSEEEDELGGGGRKRRRRRGGRSRRDDDRDDTREDSGTRQDSDSGSRGGRKKTPKKKPSKDRDERGSGKKESKNKTTKKKRKSRDERAASKVRTLEPEYVDTSAFDVELDPTKAATFGSLVEGPNKRRKPRTVGTDDDYRPPSLDDGGSAPPPPQPKSDDDTFGDW